MSYGQSGFSLMEVLVAMVLMGIIAVAFLGALSTAHGSVFIADERATAASLAYTQIEYVRNQPYSSAPWNYTVTSSQCSSTNPPSWYSDTTNNPPLLSADYVGYTVYVNAVLLPSHSPDDGLQGITVTVSSTNPSRPPITFGGYISLP